jgi:hypothetical protein
VQDRRLELARAALEAWNRQDIDSFVEAFHPECVIHAQLALTAEPYRGHEGVRRWHREGTESFGGFVVHWHELRPVGERVLALGTLELRGAASGIEITPDVGHVATYEGDLIKTLRVFVSHAEAEAAAAEA